MGSTRLAAAAAAGLATLYAVDARAGGLFLPGFGPSATARAGAWTAAADDPTALIANPAGLDNQWGTVVYVGSMFLDYQMSFSRAGTYDPVPQETHPWDNTPYATVKNDAKPPIGFGSYQALPAIAVSTDLGGKVKGLRVGFGVFVPSSYPTRSMGAGYKFDDPAAPPPPTRYDVVDQQAAIVLPSVGASYHVSDKLSLGARFTWGLADIKATTYTWGFPGNYEEGTIKDSLFHLEAKDNFAPAWGLGALYKLNDNIQLGASYSSPVSVRATGTGTAQVSTRLVPATIILPIDETVTKPRCASGGQPGALKGCIDLDLPQHAEIGARWLTHDGPGRVNGDIELDLAWENWSSDYASNYHVNVDARAADPTTMATIFNLHETIIRHGLQDTYSIRVGGSRKIIENVIVRGGVAYDTKTAKASWERADMDGSARITYALGASYLLDKLKLDAGLGYVYEGTRTMGTNPPCNPTSTAPGCSGNGTQTPVANRDQPDPIQPLSDPNGTANFQNPINSGSITSHYLYFSLAATYQF